MSITFHPVGFLLGYNIGNLSDELLVLRIEHGGGRDEGAAVARETTDFLLTPEAALQLGQHLIERATLAFKPSGTRPS